MYSTSEWVLTSSCGTRLEQLGLYGYCVDSGESLVDGSMRRKRARARCDMTFARISGGIAERTLHQNRRQHERLIRIAEAMNEVGQLAALKEKRAKKTIAANPPAAPRPSAAKSTAA